MRPSQSTLANFYAATIYSSYVMCARCTHLHTVQLYSLCSAGYRLQTITEMTGVVQNFPADQASGRHDSFIGNTGSFRALAASD